ncbi:MAG: efflux RND transporter periplasmic adaptor subunit [Candidatus Gastranaerophilales bacterium]|nr:efflux RND transporter periplasmic adaptor subunit [Candidatus Gastranaerophilales bacterium]
MNKKIFFAIVLIVVIGLIFFIPKKKNSQPIQTAEIVKHSLSQTVEASGTVNPVQSVNIGSQVSGRIYKLYVDYNSKVKKGQLLAEIDPALFQASVDKARADLNNATANYHKVLAQVNYKKANYERFSRLYKKHYVSKDETELAYSNYMASRSELAGTQAIISQAKANLETAETNLNYTKIISPVDGVVVSRAVDVGQTVAASFQTPELFVVAEDLTKMQIEVSVSEADIGKIHEGQKAEYTLDGYPDETFEGYVSQIRLNPTTVSNVTTYTVIVAVNNDEEILKPGMNANVTIITQNKEDVLCVPNMALKYVPENVTEKFHEHGVWILNDNKKPERITVKIGLKDGDYTEVESDKLKEGMKVLVASKKTKKKQAGPPRMF